MLPFESSVHMKTNATVLEPRRNAIFPFIVDVLSSYDDRADVGCGCHLRDEFEGFFFNP